MFSEYEDLKQDLDGGNDLRPNTIKFKKSMKKEELEQELKKRFTAEQIQFEDYESNIPPERVQYFYIGWYVAFARAKYIIDDLFSYLDED